MTRDKQQTWFIYILECNDQTFYTGVTTDLQRRLREHNSGKLGARYTAARRPVQLVYHETAASRSAAQQREYQIRTLPRSEKQRLVAAFR
ncbi:MAG: GIY-YIG nuclease family protein [Thioalkalispiraceae bacterium]|jgi:putative endonuclease